MNVMKRAWGIARKGQEQFGGQVTEYFVESLKIAWTEKKGMDAQQKQIEEKGVELFNKYINSIVSKGGKLISQEGTKCVVENMGKEHTVTMEMKHVTVYVNVQLGKRVESFNIGEVA